MKFELDDYHRGITDDELIADLKRIALDLKKNSLTRFDNDENGKYGTTTYVRRFGSWFNALERAGLEKSRTPMNLSDEELFLNVEEVWVKLGRQPRYEEVQKPISKFHVGTYENHFGTWRKALEKFVAYINDAQSTFPKKITENPQARLNKGHKTARTINWRIRFIVMKRDNFKCKNCGRSPATDSKVILHVDHVKAWSKGGETVLENLQTLCSVCNIGKSNLE